VSPPGVPISCITPFSRCEGRGQMRTSCGHSRRGCFASTTIPPKHQWEVDAVLGGIAVGGSPCRMHLVVFRPPTIRGEQGWRSDWAPHAAIAIS
jgi:hypothetical protein